MNSQAARRVENFQRHQANELAELDRQQGRPPSLGDLRRINEMRTQNAQLFANLELQLPQAMPADTPARYEARLLNELKRHSPKWRSTDMGQLARANALGPVGREVRKDAQAIADDGLIGSFRNPGQLRRVEKVDQSGRKVTEWHGPVWFGRAFQLPYIQNIVRFGDGRGNYYDTSGKVEPRR